MQGIDLNYRAICSVSHSSMQYTGVSVLHFTGVQGRSQGGGGHFGRLTAAYCLDSYSYDLIVSSDSDSIL